MMVLIKGEECFKTEHDVVSLLGYDTSKEYFFRDCWFVRVTSNGKINFSSATPSQALDLYERVRRAGMVPSSALENYVRKITSGVIMSGMNVT